MPMSKRIINPEFFTDEKIIELSIPAKLLFIGLWCYVDDYGKGEMSPIKIKLAIMPCDNLDIYELINELIANDLIRVYMVEEKQYFHVRHFAKHQSMKYKKATNIPAIPPNSSKLEKISPNSSKLLQNGENFSKLENISPNSSKLEKISHDIDIDIDKDIDKDKDNKKNKRKDKDCQERKKIPDPPQRKPRLLEIQFNDQTNRIEGITSSLLSKWQQTYPAVDIAHEIAEAESWLMSNPEKRKKNYPAFLNNWFNREQERKMEQKKHSTNGQECSHDYDETSGTDYYNIDSYHEALLRGESNMRLMPNLIPAYKKKYGDKHA